MVNHGWPLRSITAIGEPSSTAEALPTPRKRSAQLISNAPVPGQLVGAAQACKILFNILAVAFAAQLEQRAQQALEVALAPVRSGDAQHAAVEVDQPATPVAVKQDVVLAGVMSE